ncbi:MAG TPA: hypothetical protein VGD35_21050 [Chitinophaga sp.]
MKQFLFRLLATLAVGTVLAAPAVSEWWSPALPVTAPVPANDVKADSALIRKLADISCHLDSVHDAHK